MPPCVSPLLCVQQPGHQHGEPVDEVEERPPRWVALRAHADGLQHAARAQLIGDRGLAEHAGTTGGVRLDAADVMRLSGVQDLHEEGKLVLGEGGMEVGAWG